MPDTAPMIAPHADHRSLGTHAADGLSTPSQRAGSCLWSQVRGIDLPWLKLGVVACMLPSSAAMDAPAAAHDP